MDPVRTAIMNNRLTAIVEEASATLHRTAHTTFVKLVQDYQCALANPEGEMVAYPSQSGVVVFVGLSLKATLDRIGRENLRPGDVIITNCPFTSDGMVTHLMDVTLLRPLFHEGELVAIAWSFVHASDIGGAVPGSVSPAFTEVFQEGLRLRPMFLYRAGILNQDVKDIILDNTRIPDEMWGDLNAMNAALRSMERHLGALCARYGTAMVRAGMDDVLTFAEGKARSVIEKIPDGIYRFSDYLEGFTEEQLTFFNTEMRVEGDEIFLDYTGTDPQIPAAYNFVSGSRTHPYVTQALIAFILTHEPDCPRNAGILRPIQSNAPRGTIINAEFPAAGGARVAASTRVYDTILACLNQAVPGGVSAAGSGMAGIIVVAARDKMTGKNRVSVINPICGGGGGRAVVDGVDGVEVRYGALRTVPVEIIEVETVIHMRSYCLLPDSQAAGRYQGGAAVVMEIENTGFEATMTVRGMNRFQFRPWGVDGGEAGRLGEVILDPGLPAEKSIGKISVLKLGQGQAVRIVSSAGGGFGDPLARDPTLVAADVRRGLVSAMRARTAYGVLLDRDGNVDAQATAQERASLTAGRETAARFSFGPEREAYDRIWPAELRARLAVKVLAEQPSLRHHLLDRVRSRLVQNGLEVSAAALDRVFEEELRLLGGAAYAVRGIAA